MTAPSILVIDDQYAASEEDRIGVKACFALGEPGEDLSSGQHLGVVTFFSGLTKGRFDVAASVKEVRKRWSESDEGARWALVVVDYHFVQDDKKSITGGGKQIVQAIRSQIMGDVPVVLFSSSDPTKIEPLVEGGVVAYLKKPSPKTSDTKDIRLALQRILLQHGLFPDGPVRYIDQDGRVQTVASSRRPMAGDSLAFLKTLRDCRASLLRTRPATVLIEGPEGSGKDELVRYIHDWGKAAAFYGPDIKAASEWQSGKIVSLRIGEMDGPATVNKLFGKRKPEAEAEVPRGARFGTLHVDQIECLPHSSQRFFARRIEEGLALPAGERTDPLQCHLIFTTDKSMQQLQEDKQLVSNLADLLDVIEAPSLFDRQEAETLLEHFLAEAFADGEASVLTQGAKNVVSRSRWPGNVRQLRRVAALLRTRNEFRKSVTEGDVTACIDKTSSCRSADVRRGVRGLTDRIAAQTISENERLDGILKDLRIALAELVKRILIRKEKDFQNNFAGTVKMLLDDHTLVSHQPEGRLSKWMDLLEIDPSDPDLAKVPLGQLKASKKRPIK